MLPVMKGAAATRRAILAYSLILAPLGVAPALVGLGGPAYAAAAIAGGALFLLLALRVFRSRAGDAPDGWAGRDGDLYDAKLEAKPARDLFAYSILYLFGLFAVLLGERVLGWVA
jgi:protoheme IX farnesyltransferase